MNTRDAHVRLLEARHALKEALPLLKELDMEKSHKACLVAIEDIEAEIITMEERSHEQAGDR